MRRAPAVLFSAVMAVAVLFPIAGDRSDSFPLSSYPMFSGNLEGVNDVRTVVGRTADGTRVTLSPEAISGSDEVMLAAADVGRAVAAGPAATAALCGDVAHRVGTRGPRDVVTIEVVTERYDAIAYFGGDEEPAALTVHSSCRVAG